MNLFVVGLLMAISFVIGAVFAPGPASSDSYGTCAGGCWNIHPPGFFGVKLDSGLKIKEVNQISDHTATIRIVER